jgi:hypothetical protein
MTSTVHKIPESLSDQYSGSGWALASISNGQVVSLKYVADVAPQKIVDQIEDASDHAAFFIRCWVTTAEAGQVIRELQALGDVKIGMCSCWEFIEQ